MRTVSVVAHRGFSSAAPENTLVAFRKAIDLGADMLECDVRRSRDGALVVIHDPEVDRTTDGKGAVSGMSLEKIKNLDAGSWFGEEFAGVGIPTLDEVLDLVKMKARLIIELKEDDLEDDVVSAVQKRQMSSETLIASFSSKAGLRIPGLDPEILFVLLAFRLIRLDDEESVRLTDEAAAVNASILGLNYQAISPAVVRTVHAANLQLLAWTVDEANDIRVQAEMGVDIIASNRLEVLSDTLSAMGLRK